ncbi:MAG: EAL domain-containing protein [Synergistaceae bacterium]|jgi:diguanylate cyclase (GGDEF)-like protein/PAS domain S-box-containing protein|nr:EAL domain-containing protein [Synergistaceae bacterium]
MSLLKKFLYSVSSLLILLSSLMAFSSGRSILSSFEIVERYIFERNMKKFDDHLYAKRRNLLRQAVNLASRDQVSPQDFLATGQIHILPTQIAVLFDFSTNAVTGYKIDAAGNKIPLSPSFSRVLAQSLRQLYSEKLPLFSIDGLLKIEAENFIVGIAPVVNETHESQSVVVVGEILEEFLASIFHVIEENFQLLDLEKNPSSLSATELSKITNNSERIDVTFVSEKEAVVYYAFTGILGEADRLFVRSEMKRFVYSGITKALANSYIWIVLLSVLTVTLVIVTFDKLVLLRLKRVQKIMDDISYNWQVSLRIPPEGNDEITQLSRSFNTMLKALEALISNVPDPLVLCKPDGTILLTNAATRELLDYPREEDLMALSFDSVFIEKEKTTGPVEDLFKNETGVFEAAMRRSDGSSIPVEIHQEILTFENNSYTLSIARDLTERKIMEARLVKIAFYDAQTGLPNRHYFLDELEKELRNISTIAYYTFCVAFINMDKFKLVNEQLGPRGADQVIVKVAERISGIIVGFASAFRLSGDEFGIIMRGTNSKEYVRSLLQRIQRLLNIPISIDGKTVFPSASFGVVLDIRSSSTSSQILSLGTDALREGKKRGIGTITFLTMEEEENVNESKHHRYNLLAFQARMQQALSASEFVAYFQPIYQLMPSGLSGFETLVRWDHPQHGLLSPGTFIPQAEETGFITEIDKFIICRAISVAKKWSMAYPEVSFFLSANASGASFKEPGLVPFICDRVEEEALDPRYLVLEVTEGIFIENLETTNRKLSTLREFGVKIALDDFGTGYSSLQYINQLPIDYIKIDKSFIDQLFLSEKNSLMVRSIINMARDLKFDVVAEGVENQDQVHWLGENHAAKGQGYFFSRPIPMGEAENLLADAKIFRELSL